MKKNITLILLIISFLFIFNLKPEAKTTKNLVNIYLFHSNTCSHCQEEIKFLNTLEERYNNIKIYKYELHDEKNLEILTEVEKIYTDKFDSVPLTIIGNEIYTGFSDNSKITFIKTIEYFSKYSYEDKIAKHLSLEQPSYSITKDTPSLEKFISKYHNYNLLGLNTDNLDTNNISILLGITLSINPISIIALILVLLLISKFKEERMEILSLILYLVSITILLLSSLLNNYIFTIITYILLILIFIYNLLKTNKRQSILLNCIIIIPIIESLIITYIDNKNILIFKNLLNLHKPSGLNLIYYYSNCLMIYLIINFLLIYIGYIVIVKKLINNKLEKELKK